MAGRFLEAVLLVATTGLAANLPRFAFTASGSLTGTAITKDSRGNTYLTGSATGSVFNATPGAFQSQNAGGTCNGGSGGIGPPIPFACKNAFVIKLSPAGVVVFATYLGGTGNATSSAIVVDSEENVYVSGTVSFGACQTGAFPVNAGAAFTSSSSSCSFVTKLDAGGTRLVYSTLIPGAALASIALDGAGDVFFTGGWAAESQYGDQFPATAGTYQSSPADSVGATVVGKLNASGSALIYATYLSGRLGPSNGVSIAVDSGGNAFIAGTDEGSDFPVTAGQFSTSLPYLANVYLAKLNADGSDLIYSTLLGPASALAMKVAPGGDIYIGCGPAAADFPSTSGGFGVAAPAAGAGDFLLHLAADGSTVLSSLYVPFALTQGGGTLDVDAAGNAYIVGNADRSLQTSAGAFQSVYSGNGPYDTAIAKITPDGAVAGVTNFGPGGANSLATIAAMRDGSVVVAGLTGSVDFLGVMPPASAVGNFFFAANLFPAITIENSASYVANKVVPGEMMSIQGYGMGPVVGLNALPVTEVGGVQVYFDNFAAPITYVQAAQINVQAPWEIAGQMTTQLRVVYNGVQAGSAVVPLGAALPGVFYINNSDGSRNSPSNPARPGDYVAVYGTGGGAMSLPGVTGSSWPLAPFSLLTQPVSVAVGGEVAAVLYAGSAPTLNSGFFQINARLPPDLTSAAKSLCVTVDGVTSSPAAVTIQ
jgi:uncharacterized protein (TIGR03437 family)